MDTIEDAPELVGTERYRWETDALATEIRGILDAIDAPPTDDRVMFAFQKILYRCRMFNADGRGQIILTCRCILESTANEGAFSEPFVSAVHNVCSKKEFAERGLDLIAGFDQIDLLGIWQTMRSLELFRKSDAPSVLSQIVRNKLSRILFPPQPEPVKQSKREKIAAAKASVTRLAQVERNMEMGRQLIALRDLTPNNRAFGRLRTNQFDVDTVAAAEMMRVARLYGDRPEIYRKVRWAVLVELASSVLSESCRQEFERRIVAGVTVRANEVAAARMPRKIGAATAFDRSELTLGSSKIHARPLRGNPNFVSSDPRPALLTPTVLGWIAW
jgi:hypothetical protein